MSVHNEVKRITITDLLQKKQRKEKITMLTAYDYSMALLLDQAGIDILLVGDSAANVSAGHETTLPITLDQMIYHASCVMRATKHALVIADLPFGSYQSSPEAACTSAIRMMKEAGVQGVKVEGGAEIKASIQRIISAGIPVMGHLGLTPQSVHQLGGYRLRSKTKLEAEKLKSDALLLQELGCFALVLEKIPAELAKTVTEERKIPVIGIGAGADTDGQVLVINDLLGMDANRKPPCFVRKYRDLATTIKDAVKEYIKDVTTKSFPNAKEQYSTSPE